MTATAAPIKWRQSDSLPPFLPLPSQIHSYFEFYLALMSSFQSWLWITFAPVFAVFYASSLIFALRHRLQHNR